MQVLYRGAKHLKSLAPAHLISLTAISQTGFYQRNSSQAMLLNYILKCTATFYFHVGFGGWDLGGILPFTTTWGRCLREPPVADSYLVH